MHLHLHDELSATGVPASHIDDAVLLACNLRDHLGRQVLHRRDRGILGNGKQGVEQTHHQVFVLAEDQFEGQVSLWVQILAVHCLFSFHFVFDILHSN